VCRDRHRPAADASRASLESSRPLLLTSRDQDAA
jgi:hypothetical protein